MKHLFLFTAIFYLCGAVGQSIVPFSVKEPSRGEIIAYPTSADADSLGTSRSRYLSPLEDWVQVGDSLNTTFTVPFAWANRDIILRVSSASADYSVIVNGRELAYNSNANVPTDFNLTKSVKEGRNTLSLKINSDSPMAKLESWKEGKQPVVVGEAYVMSQPTIRVRDLYIKSTYSGTEMNGEVGIVVKTSSLNPKSAQIYYELTSPNNEMVAHGQPKITLEMRNQDTLRFVTTIPQDSQWDLDSAKLYTLKLKTKIEGRYAEYLQFKVGFRTVEMKERGRMAINGEMVALHIANVEPNISAEEIAKLKADGYNTLKPKAGIIAKELYNICDTMGMYVIAPTPIDSSNGGKKIVLGGNITNDTTWNEEYINRAESSYHTTKGHPSVIAFSIADNSANGINLYESYLNIKSKDDPRPTIYLDSQGEWNNDILELKFEPIVKGSNF